MGKYLESATMQQEINTPFCSVRNCKDFKNNGDNLFCSKHRTEWRQFVNTFNLDLITPETVIEAGLKAFKSGGC